MGFTRHQNPATPLLEMGRCRLHLGVRAKPSRTRLWKGWLESALMTRSTRALLLLLLMCCQALSLVSPWTVGARAAEVAHMTVHAQSTGHHHHDDDFSMHADEAGTDDVQHQHADSGLQPPGLTPDSPFSLASLRPSVPANRDEQAGPSPSLERLKRPPRASS
jgi:hypothetical protein